MEIEELRQLHQQIMLDQISSEHLGKRMIVYDQTEKRLRIIMAKYALSLRIDVKRLKHL